MRGCDRRVTLFNCTAHLEDAPDCKVKRLVVKPGQVLSLQKHHKRAEHWTVISGVAKVRLGEKEFLLNPNEST